MACRYMAVDKIRLMLAYILLHYHVDVGENGPRPRNTFFRKITFSDMTAHIVFKKPEGQ